MSRALLALLLAAAAAALPAGPRGEVAALQELSRLELRARISELERELRAQRPEVRRSAVRRLVGLDRPEAWRLVLRALEDPDSMVGDAAQRSLGGLDDPDVASDLLGRAGLESRDERAALRAAEAVGRLPLEVDGELLARRLSTREQELTRRLLWSLERLADAGRLGGRPERLWSALLGLHRSRRSAELAGRALVTLASLGYPDLSRIALEASRADRAELRCASLIALRRASRDELAVVARVLAADPQPRVRALAVDALGDLGTRDALLTLVERLEAEPRLALRVRLVQVLQQVSGLKYRADPRPWRQVVERLPVDWSRPQDSGPASAERAQATVARGPLRIPVDSDRVAFLFDFSGSMWTPLPDGRTPKEIVAARLRDALEALPPEAELNLVPFAHEPHPWREELVEARPARVREALEFFERCRERGKGNAYDAALLALSDPRVDRVVVLTDGVPTGGLHSNLDLVVDLLLEHDLLRGVAFDAVLVDPPRAVVPRWRRLCAQTGGRVVEVALQ